MQSSAKTPQEYIDSLPADRREAICKIREAILANLPQGFEETIGYGMLGWCPIPFIPKAIIAIPRCPCLT